MVFDGESVHLSIGDFLADGVIPILEDGLHRQAWGGRCATDKGQQRRPGGLEQLAARQALISFRIPTALICKKIAR